MYPDLPSRRVQPSSPSDSCLVSIRIRTHSKRFLVICSSLRRTAATSHRGSFSRAVLRNGYAHVCSKNGFLNGQPIGGLLEYERRLGFNHRIGYFLSPVGWKTMHEQRLPARLCDQRLVHL